MNTNEQYLHYLTHKGMPFSKTLINVRGAIGMPLEKEDLEHLAKLGEVETMHAATVILKTTKDLFEVNPNLSYLDVEVNFETQKVKLSYNNGELALTYPLSTFDITKDAVSIFGDCEPHKDKEYIELASPFYNAALFDDVEPNDLVDIVTNMFYLTAVAGYDNIDMYSYQMNETIQVNFNLAQTAMTCNLYTDDYTPSYAILVDYLKETYQMFDEKPKLPAALIKHK